MRDYITEINSHIEGGVVQVRETEQLRKHLEVEAGKLHSKLAKAGGSRKRTAILEDTHFLVGREDAVNLREYCEDTEAFKVYINDCALSLICVI